MARPWTFTKDTLIGQLATVYICDWLTKDEQIHKLSSSWARSTVSIQGKVDVLRCKMCDRNHLRANIIDFLFFCLIEPEFGLESNGFRYVLSTTLAIKKMHVACLFKLM